MQVERPGARLLPASAATARLRPARADRVDGAATRRRARWSADRLALAGVLALSAGLNLVRLTREGDGNLYYAAAVRSMLERWRNLFFVSFDPGGFVTIDKPPLGFWLQAASAKLFGFQGLSLLLPQAVAGVLSVALLFALVRRAFGPTAGALAALALAVTPINVATNRANTVDALLALTTLAAVWAVSRAAETGRLRWLLLGAALVGLGFNIKMLEAYLILPAFFLVALVASRRRWRTRLVHLAAATVVLLAVSFVWVATVDLTPADQRPYVGSSLDNSELNLIFGYNGLNRVLPRGWHIFGFTIGQVERGAPPGETAGQAPPSAGAGGPSGGFAGETGARGLLRLFNPRLAGQLGWLLPLALLGLLAAAWRTRPQLPLNRRETGLLLWGGWLLSVAAFFSYASQFHVYYTVMLTPAIAACAGFGLVALWRDYRRGGWRGWLLPAALLVTAAVQTHILADYPTWHDRLSPAILGLAEAAAFGLIAWRLPGVAARARSLRSARLRRWSARCPLALTAAGVLALLIAPTVWAGYTTWTQTAAMIPSAGPRPATADRGPANAARLPGAFTGRGDRAAFGGLGGFGEPTAPPDPRLLAFLAAHRGGARFLVATPNATAAAPLIIATGEPVMALGGFTGADPILTPADLARLVADGTVRYFLMPRRGRGGAFSGLPTAAGQAPAGPTGEEETAAPRGGFGGFVTESTTWVVDHCTPVPAAQWQSSSGGAGRPGEAETLYDCAGAPRAS